MAAQNEIENAVQPNVKFEGRARTNAGCGYLFLVGLLVQFVIGIVFLTDTSRIVLNPALEFPDSCSQHYCFYSSRGCASSRELQVIDHLGTAISACEDRCGDNYQYIGGHSCMKTKDMPCLEGISNRWIGERRLAADDDPEKMRFDEIMADSLELMILSGGLIVIAAIAWGYAIKAYTIQTIYGTIGLTYTAMASLAIWAQSKDIPDIATFLVFLGICLSIFFFTSRKKIPLTANLLKEACQGLQAHPSVFGYALLLKSIWLLYTGIFLIAMIRGLLIGHAECEESEMEMTNVRIVKPMWALLAKFIFGIQYLWTTALIQQFRWATIAGTISMWYFHTDDVSMPRHPVRTSFVWACTKSLGTHSLSAIVVVIMETISRWMNNRCMQVTNACNPVMWFFMCIWKLFESFFRAFTRYTTVIHVMSGDPLLKSGKKTYGLLKRHIGTALASGGISTIILKMGAIIISYVICWTTFISLDLFYDVNYASLIDSKLGLSFIAVYFLIVVMYPTIGALIILLFAALDLKSGSIMIVASCLGVIACFIFRYMASIILDAFHSTLVCYAAAKDNSLRWTRTEELERLITLTVVDPSISKISVNPDCHQNV